MLKGMYVEYISMYIVFDWWEGYGDVYKGCRGGMGVIWVGGGGGFVKKMDGTVRRGIESSMHINRANCIE